VIETLIDTEFSTIHETEVVIVTGTQIITETVTSTQNVPTTIFEVGIVQTTIVETEFKTNKVTITDHVTHNLTSTITKSDTSSNPSIPIYSLIFVLTIIGFTRKISTRVK